MDFLILVGLAIMLYPLFLLLKYIVPIIGLICIFKGFVTLGIAIIVTYFIITILNNIYSK